MAYIQTVSCYGDTLPELTVALKDSITATVARR